MIPKTFLPLSDMDMFQSIKFSSDSFPLKSWKSTSDAFKNVSG